MSSKKECNLVPACAGIDAVLHHILGFMDAREAVQTSVLARPWRHLWKSATAVRMGPTHLAGVLSFMEHLLLLRGGSRLDTLKLPFYGFEDGDVRHVNLWVRHALLCKVQKLTFRFLLRPFPLDDLLLVSQHLRNLQLTKVVLMNNSCDFSGCPSLEHVAISYSILPNAKKISFQSVKRLSMHYCSFNQNQGLRTRIYAPSLVSLKLDDLVCLTEQHCRTPILQNMPALREASVRLAQKNADCCSHADESGRCGDVNCNSCYGIQHHNNYLLLKGLSEAENLELIAESKTIVFKRDLRQCPTFSKLKTLSLNDYWCVAPDFLALTCILKHAPILERLTLLLYSKWLTDKLRIKGSRNPMELSATREHLKTLKTIDIKCEVIDEKIIKVVKFLSTFDIRFSLEEVEILEPQGSFISLLSNAGQRTQEQLKI